MQQRQQKAEFYGLHKSDFVPTPKEGGNTNDHIVDRFLKIISDADHLWISAGMPLEKSMALVRIIHVFIVLLYGRPDIRLDIANIMSAYAGRDRLMLKTAERVASHTPQPGIDPHAAATVASLITGNPDSSRQGVSPSPGGE